MQYLHKKNAGFNLVELLVALAIAAFLMVGLVQVFSSIRASYDLQEGLSRLQENTRFVSTFLNRQLRETGYFPFPEHENLNIDIGFTFPSVLTGDIPPLLTANTVDGGGSNSDTIEASYFSEFNCNDTLNPPSTTGNPIIGHKQVSFAVVNNELRYTCRFGAPVIGAAPPAVITNQPLLSNIETLQFQYGEDISGDGSADRYVDAGSWAAVGNIVAIRVGIILTSPIIGTLQADNQTINLLGDDFVPSNQSELRRPVVLNITLRNQTL